MYWKHASEWPGNQDSEDCEVHTVIAQLTAKHHTRDSIHQEGAIRTLRDSRIVCDTIMRTGKCKRNTRPSSGFDRTLGNARGIALSEKHLMPRNLSQEADIRTLRDSGIL